MDRHYHSAQGHDVATDRWLRDDVVPVYDAMKTYPEQGIVAERVFAEIHERHRRHTTRPE